MGKTTVTALFMLVITSASAQQVISLAEAFKLCLANNYAVKMTELTEEQAGNSATVGQAGLLPQVSLSGAYGANVTDTKLEFAGELPAVDRKGAQSSNLSAGIDVDYVVLGGWAGSSRLNKLRLNAAAVAAQGQTTIEAQLFTVASAYISAVQLGQQADVMRQSIGVSQQRLRRAELAAKSGIGPRTDALQAAVDLAADSASLLRLEQQLKSAMLRLKLGMNTAEEFTVETDLGALEMMPWTLETLEQEAVANNAAAKSASLQMAIAQADLNVAKAALLPTLALSAGYGLNRQQSEAGIILSNTGLGWNAGVSLTYPLFNGSTNRIALENRQLAQEVAALQQANQQAQLKTDLETAWTAYTSSLEIARFERKNAETAQLNETRALLAFEQGSITSLVFRQAQLANAAAKSRLADAAAAVKLNELELLRLSGQLLKQ